MLENIVDISTGALVGTMLLAVFGVILVVYMGLNVVSFVLAVLFGEFWEQ